MSLDSMSNRRFITLAIVIAGASMFVGALIGMGLSDLVKPTVAAEGKDYTIAEHGQIVCVVFRGIPNDKTFEDALAEVGVKYRNRIIQQTPFDNGGGSFSNRMRFLLAPEKKP